MLYAHNQGTYNQVCRALKEKNNLCLVQGTGVGKSFLAIALIKERFSGKRVLFVCPKRAIEINLKKYKDFADVGDRVDFLYNAVFLNRKVAEDVFRKYDVFFVDEAHHMGAEMTGNVLHHLLQMVKTSSDKYFIGMTATPVRDSDHVNVTDFFDNTVYGLSTFECIENGLMPKVEYLVCKPEKELSAEERAIYKEKLSIENSNELLQNIIQTNPKERWLCYYPSISEMNANHETVCRLFPGYRVIKVSSDTKHSQDMIDGICDGEKVVIESVDMLLEGIHLPKMQGILLFRNVSAVGVFLQIFGRITAIGETESPLFVDCTSTAFRLLHHLLSVDNSQRMGVSSNKAQGKCLKNILHISLQNQEFFDVGCLLMAASENARTFEYKGVVYPSFSDAVKAFGFSFSHIASIMRKNHCTREEAFSIMDAKGKRDYHFSFRGEVFPTMSAAAECYGLNPKTVSSYKTKNGCDLQEAMETLLSLEKVQPCYNGKTYHTIKELCEDVGVSYKSVLGYMTRSSMSLQAAVDKAVSGESNYQFSYDGIVYQSKADACRKLGLDWNTVSKYTVRHHCTVEEAIGSLLNQPRKKGFMFRETCFPSYKAACAEYEVDYVAFVKKKDRMGVSAENALEALIEAKETKRISVNGKTYDGLAEAADDCGLAMETIRSYMHAHQMNASEAITAILSLRGSRQFTYDGVTYPSLQAAAAAYGTTANCVRACARYYNITREDAFKKCVSGRLQAVSR